MATEPAQPAGAAENGDFDAVSAIDAWLADEGALGGPAPEKPRDEKGRFAPQQAAEDAADDEIEANADAPEGEQADAENEGGDEQGEEAADEAQPADALPLPPSWSKEDEATWNELPAPVQAKIFAREAQREQAINSKFQEAANVRRAAEQQAVEAANSRKAYIQQLEAVEQVIVPAKPPLSMLNPQSPDYDPDRYHLSAAQYEQTVAFLQQIRQQRATAEAEAAAQQEAQDAAWREQMNAQWQPKLLATVPELADPAKQGAILTELNRYALENGYDAEQLQAATAADVLVLWKAAQFDKQRAAAQRLQANGKQPQPKPAPAVRPGVATSAPAAQRAQLGKAKERLAKTGRGEDAVSIFEQLLG